MARMAVQAVRHLLEADRLGLGTSRLAEMEFPVLSMVDAVRAFTEAAYGEALTFEHA